MGSGYIIIKALAGLLVVVGAAAVIAGIFIVGLIISAFGFGLMTVEYEDEIV